MNELTWAEALKDLGKFAKKALLIFLGMIGAFLAVILILFWLVCAKQNDILIPFSNQLFNYPLPEQTELLHKDTYCGELQPEGLHRFHDTYFAYMFCE